jgi:hypothetical protein
MHLKISILSNNILIYNSRQNYNIIIMKDYLLSFDFLGIKPQVFFKSQSKFSTWTGLFFSSIICIAISVFGIFFLRECTDRTIYFLTSTEEYVGNETLNLLDLGYEIVFDVRSGIWEPFPEFERYISLTTPGFYTNLTRCTLQDKGFLPPVPPYDFTENIWCFNPKDKLETARYGGPKNIMLVVRPCVNETSRPDLEFSDGKTSAQKDNCYPIEKIEEKLNKNEFYIFVRFFDNQLNHTSTSNIFTKMQNDVYLKLSTQIYVRYMMKFQIIDYNLDLGFIFEDINRHKSYMYVGYDTQINLVNKGKVGDPKYGMFDINLDPNRKLYNRSYVKLQTVAANIGGVAKFFLMIGEVVSFLYLRNLFFLDLCNSFFNYSNLSQDKTKHCSQKISSAFALYKEKKKNLIDEQKEVSVINCTSKTKFCFVSESNNLKSENKLKVEENINIQNEGVKTNNYMESHEKSNARIKLGLENQNIFVESKGSLAQSFWQIVFCPSKLFKASKIKAYNLLSYERIIHSVVELSELKDYLINDNSVKYIGNCKLSFDDCD